MAQSESALEIRMRSECGSTGTVTCRYMPVHARACRYMPLRAVARVIPMVVLSCTVTYRYRRVVARDPVGAVDDAHDQEEREWQGHDEEVGPEGA